MPSSFSLCPGALQTPAPGGEDNYTEERFRLLAVSLLEDFSLSTITDTPKVNIVCSACQAEKQVRPLSGTEEGALPRGWKRLAGAVWCNLCWQKAFILRS